MVDASQEQACARYERPVVRRLLDLFEQYETPVTWAFVGRLLDDSRGFDGLRGDRSNWFAPDLIDLIRQQHVEHEIGTHTNNHIYYDSASRDQVLEDLLRAKEVHSRHGLPFRSLVFPRNMVGHLDVLAELGIEVFRSVDAGLLGQCDRYAPRVRPIANLLEKSLPLSPPLVSAVLRDGGLVELPSSMLLIGRNGLRRVASVAAMRTKLRLGIEGATNKRSMFHLWFHPSNFYFQPESQFSLLESALSTAANLRNQGKLDILPMGAVGLRMMDRTARTPIG